MILGIGIDIAENARFASLPDSFLKKIFTSKEMELASSAANQIEYYSSRFAAKEAFAKALGTGFRGIALKEIEILEDELGRPYINVLSKLDKDCNIHLSFAHEKTMSVAMVVLEDG